MVKLQPLKRRTRVALSLTFITGFFIWAVYFFFHISLTYPRVIPDKLTVWIGMIIAASLLLVGVGIGESLNWRKLLMAFVFVALWSAGFLFVSFPQGYGEAVLGFWTVLGIIVIALFFRYQELKKSKKQNNK
ncbi:MAG: hypothetical protein ACFFCW_42630 [Candidatus Hodarchaeota archaeon]